MGQKHAPLIHGMPLYEMCDGIAALFMVECQNGPKVSNFRDGYPPNTSNFIVLGAHYDPMSRTRSNLREREPFPLKGDRDTPILEAY